LSEYLDKNKEEELVIKAQKDYSAFDKLYEYYLPRIYGYILSRVQNKEEAQDITSQTFEKAMLGLKDFEARDNIRFSSWLYRIAINNLTDYYRWAAKRKNADISDYQNKLKDEKDNQAEDFARKDEIIRNLEKISEEGRQILELKFFQDLSNEEISEILGISYSHLGVKIFRALKKLKEIIKENE